VTGETYTYGPGVAMTPEQTRRAMCLAAALALLSGRSVHVGTVREVARWLYTGEEADVQ